MIRKTAAGLYVIDSDSHISAWVEEKNQLQHDFQTLPLILPLINAGDVVVDVGANIGDTTGPFLERVGLTGEVWAFEPNMDAWECLTRNLANYPNVHCLPFALGSAGDFMLELAPNENAGARHLRKFGLESERGEAVDIATLDSLDLERVNFLKIDVEGFETHVLRGAEKTIERCRPIMLIEVNEAALRRQGTNPFELFWWLHNHEYQWWPVVGANLTQLQPQYDILSKHSHYPISDHSAPN